MNRYYIDYDTGAGNRTFEGTLEDAKRVADDGISYTKSNVYIRDDESYEVVSTRQWYGTALNPDDYEPDELDKVITIGDCGHYAPWQDNEELERAHEILAELEFKAGVEAAANKIIRQLFPAEIAQHINKEYLCNVISRYAKEHGIDPSPDVTAYSINNDGCLFINENPVGYLYTPDRELPDVGRTETVQQSETSKHRRGHEPELN